MIEKDHYNSLIIRYLNGKCSEEEIQDLKHWIGETTENKNEFLEIKDVWDASAKPAAKVNDQLAVFYKNQMRKAQQSRLRWIWYSSSVAAILILGLLFSVLLPSLPLQQSAKFQVFSVPMGSKSKVVLADGTEINLNSGSELKYASDFSSENRVVYLSGEGYFHVTSDKQHPFTVKTADFDVKVTGTKFNVCTYLDNDFSSATLAEGEIELKINGTAQRFDILPGQKFGLNRTTHKYICSNTDVEAEMAWKDGEFLFKDIPFPELVQRLERWYDVKLNYSDDRLKNYFYTGKFKNQETIWQVLDALKLTSPIDYRKTTFREFTLIYKPLSNQ